MEHLLRHNLETKENNNPQAILQALSLVSNPSTSDSTLSSIAKILITSLKNPIPNSSSHHFHHHHILRLISLLSRRCLHLHHNIICAVREFSLLPSTSTRLLVDALTCLSISDSNVNDESTFISLVFQPCISVRHWLLLNVSKFDIRPSVLLTVLLGFTKDPYPYIRNVALNGLADLCKCIVVEDESLIKGCCFRAVELLSDSEDSVRCSAVRAFSACGQLIVASEQERSKVDWSDALFLQVLTYMEGKTRSKINGNFHASRGRWHPNWATVEQFTKFYRLNICDESFAFAELGSGGEIRRNHWRYFSY